MSKPTNPYDAPKTPLGSAETPAAQGSPASIQARLCAMMFLQYFVWGSWAVSLGGYAGGTLKFAGGDIGWLYSTTAIAAMISPLFVGYVADRLFATERILAVLHLIGGGLLCWCAQINNSSIMFWALLAYSICYMPTLALTNSISFQNIADSEKDFPRIRVFGTFGWIAAGLVVGLLLGGTNSNFFYLAGGASILLGLFCLALPHTPPKGGAAGDVLGLGAINLLAQVPFAVFVFCSFLICIPLAAYYGFANQFLSEIDAPAPTALQVVGQVSEVFFMAAMPFFIVRLGVKKMLLVGMFAWVLRYACFASLSFPLIVFGLVLHGVCYDFFFVASQIYVDKKAPRDQRASAQGLIALVTLGLGMFLGAMAAGKVVDHYPGMTVAVKAEGSEKTEQAGLPSWAPADAKPDDKNPDFAKTNDADKDGKLSPSEIPGTWTEGGKTYSGEALSAVYPKIDANADKQLERPEWRKAQAHLWEKIWLWPAALALGTCLLFALGFHDKVEADPKG